MHNKKFSSLDLLLGEWEKNSEHETLAKQFQEDFHKLCASDLNAAIQRLHLFHYLFILEDLVDLAAVATDPHGLNGLCKGAKLSAS